MHLHVRPALLDFACQAADTIYQDREGCTTLPRPSGPSSLTVVACIRIQDAGAAIQDTSFSSMELVLVERTVHLRSCAVVFDQSHGTWQLEPVTWLLLSTSDQPRIIYRSG